jgi:hypothetical protein
LVAGLVPTFGLWLPKAFTVSGIDGSSTAIKQASERLSRGGLTADLRVGDYSTIP